MIYNRFLVAIILSSVISSNVYADNNDFKPMDTDDYKDKNKYNFGSILDNIGGKKKVISKILKSSDDNDNKNIKRIQYSKEKMKTWEKAISLVKNYNIEYMNKESGEIRTEPIKIREFDSTDVCSYVIYIVIDENGKGKVDIMSKEDSKERLQKFSEEFTKKLNK